MLKYSNSIQKYFEDEIFLIPKKEETKNIYNYLKYSNMIRKINNEIIDDNFKDLFIRKSLIVLNFGHFKKEDHKIYGIYNSDDNEYKVEVIIDKNSYSYALWRKNLIICGSYYKKNNNILVSYSESESSIERHNHSKSTYYEYFSSEKQLLNIDGYLLFELENMQEEEFYKLKNKKVRIEQSDKNINKTIYSYRKNGYIVGQIIEKKLGSNDVVNKNNFIAKDFEEYSKKPFSQIIKILLNSNNLSVNDLLNDKDLCNSVYEQETKCDFKTYLKRIQ